MRLACLIFCLSGLTACFMGEGEKEVKPSVGLEAVEGSDNMYKKVGLPSSPKLKDGIRTLNVEDFKEEEKQKKK